MRLNPDCIRDILLTVEEMSSYSTFFIYDTEQDVHPNLQKYTHDEIIYHIRQCDMAYLITKADFFDAGNYVLVGDLTPEGHEFLANIRKDTIWQSTKDIASKVGSTSLSTLMQIACSVVTELVKGHIGIT